MFKRVLTATDMLGACELATKLAQRYGSKLFLFHVLVTSPPGYPQTELEREITPSKEKLGEFCKIPDGIEHEYCIWKGTLPYLEILKYAHEKDIDLVVMGSHTKEKGERGYVGSAVEQVSAECFCPVAVVTHPEALLKMD